MAYHIGNWELSDLFPSAEGPEFEAAFKRLDEMAAAFEKLRPQLDSGIGSKAFLDIVRQVEEISRLGQRLGAFVQLKFSENTQDQKSLALMARTEQFLAGLGNRTIFFELWWKQLDGPDAARLMADSGDYRYWLEEMRHFKPYTLSEPEEKIINIKDTTGSNALTTLYDAITNRYVFKLEVDGEVKELTRGQLSVYVRNPDPDMREKTYRELYRVYAGDGPILGQIYQTLVRDWKNENIDLRGYSSPMTVRNLGNDLPDEVVDTLLGVCRENAEVFRRFFRFKAKYLGLERLRRYDIYAPVADAEKTYEFSDAARMVLDAFQSFDPRVSSLARRVFDQRHLDSQVRPGKMDGAFCASTIPELTPWVLTNYQGRPNDVATLAHELGHAVHAMLASHHSLFTFHSALPMAETASIFGEALLIDKMLQVERDESVRRELLFRQVDDAYASILRQAYFALFERQAHEMVQEGRTVDEMAQAYLENLTDQFGDAVEIGKEFIWEWISIPHIYHTPFYVYAYTFGHLLVLALYRQYKQDGQSFIPRYLEILSAGGSASPYDIVCKAGFDIRKKDFWQSGFDEIKTMIDRLEELGD